jgi:hypothetical protein
MATQIDFAPKQVTRRFSVIVLLLVATHSGMLFSRYALGHAQLKGLLPLVDLWRENNLPTFYQSMSLLFCGLLLYLISLSER